MDKSEIPPKSGKTAVVKSNPVLAVKQTAEIKVSAHSPSVPAIDLKDLSASTRSRTATDKVEDGLEGVAGVASNEKNTGWARSCIALFRNRRMLYATLTDPIFSAPARIYYCFQMAMITASILIFLAQSDHLLNESPSQAWTFFGLEAFLNVYFLTDILLRVYACQDRRCFMVHPFNIMDVLSTFPFYFYLFYNAARGSPVYAISSFTAGVSESAPAVLRMLDMLRVFRLFKLIRANQSMQILMQALRVSKDGMVMLAMIYCVSLVVFSGLTFYFESLSCELGTFDNRRMLVYSHSVDPFFIGRPCSFQSILDAFWWCVVTICTIGYGDVIPRTIAGKAIAGLTMIIGIFLLGFPVAIFSANFADIYAEFRGERNKEAEARQELRKEWDLKNPQSTIKRVVTRSGWDLQIQKTGSYLEYVRKEPSMNFPVVNSAGVTPGASPPFDRTSTMSSKEVPERERELNSVPSGRMATIDSLPNSMNRKVEIVAATGKPTVGRRSSIKDSSRRWNPSMEPDPSFHLASDADVSNVAVMATSINTGNEEGTDSSSSARSPATTSLSTAPPAMTVYQGQYLSAQTLNEAYALMRESGQEVAYLRDRVDRLEKQRQRLQTILGGILTEIQRK